MSHESSHPSSRSSVLHMPEDHSLRPIKRWRDRVLSAMSWDFDRAYGTTGRVCIPPESLIRACAAVHGNAI
jgi:hypothetical protein